MHPRRSHPCSHPHSGHSQAALGQKGTAWVMMPLVLPCHIPFSSLVIPCTETSTDFLNLMFHRASMLPAAAIAQQHLQFPWWVIG